MKATLSILLLGLLSVIAISSVSSLADRNDKGAYEDHGSDDQDSEERAYTNTGNRWLQSAPDIDSTFDEQYLTECGACHFTYQPGLLPQSAWARIMGSLENHFGDDASLSEQQTTEIRDFLFRYSADFATSSRSRAFAAGALSDEALPRITHTRYFRREHAEIPNRFVENNPGVGSFSNCQACHRNADAGYYDEHQINIPGVGRWED